jgi:hypothetical protein
MEDRPDRIRRIGRALERDEEVLESPVEESTESSSLLQL